jgi:hypothetical protein
MTDIEQLAARVEKLEGQIARLQAGATPADDESSRQAGLYADLAAKLPWDAAAEANEASKYQASLRHPDLRLVQVRQMSLRAGGDPMGPSHVYQIPVEDRIHWFGHLRRPDGGNGMFATHKQADEWADKNASDITIGPG